MLLRQSLVAALLGVVLIPGIALGSGAVAPTVGADTADARGDVRVFTDVPGPPASDRRSIDLRRIVVEPGPASVRFRIQVARLLPDAPFDQVADLVLLPPAGADVDWAGTEVWMSTRKPRSSFARLYSVVAAPVDCSRGRTHSDPATGWFWLDVPRACLPPDRMKIRVETFATTARNDARPYSRDRLAVPGTVVWDPVDPPDPG